MTSCSKTAPLTSSTTRTQTDEAFGAAAIVSVSTPPVAMAKLAPMSVSVGAPLASLLTSCQLACVPRWKPMPMQLTTALSVRVVASAAVPGLLPPAQVDGEHYLDGGIVNSIPLGRAVRLGATRVFVLQVGRIDRPLSVPRRPWEVARVSFEIAGKWLSADCGAIKPIQPPKQ